MNPYNHPRGTICVLRGIRSEGIALSIRDQKAFREWNGCFSIV